MTLWRVEVAGISHRFVEADDKDRARAAVVDDIVAVLDLQVDPAAVVIAQLYEGLGPLQRKKVLAALDGLTTPRGLRDAKRARRRLAQQIRFDMAQRAWVADKLSSAPPIPDPELIRTLLSGTEASHVRRVRQRLHELGALD